MSAFLLGEQDRFIAKYLKVLECKFEKNLILDCFPEYVNLVDKKIMATFSQLIKNKRNKWKHKNKRYLFRGQPFVAGKALVIRGKPVVRIMTPRKPNSAKRKYVRVGWLRPKFFGAKPTQLRTNAYVSGEIKGNDFQPHGNANLLIRGGRVKDLPGMKYTIVRGHKKSLKGLSYRRQSRSKYGTSLWYLSPEERRNFTYKNFNYH